MVPGAEIGVECTIIIIIYILLLNLAAELPVKEIVAVKSKRLDALQLIEKNSYLDPALDGKIILMITQKEV